MIKDRLNQRPFSVGRRIVLFLIICNIMFAILNPGKYFELADYYYFIIAVSIIGLLNLFFKRNLFPKNNIERYLFFCFLWLIVPFFVAYFVIGQVSSAYLLSYILYFVFFYICLKYRFSNLEIGKILNSYILSGLIVGLLIISQHTMYYDTGGRYSVQVFDNPIFDPNYLAAFLVFPALLSFVIVLYSTSWKILLYIFVLFVIVGGLLMTGSRNGMISFLLGAFFIFMQRFSLKLKVSRIISLLLFISITITLVLNYVPEETYLRLFVDSYNDGSNHTRLMDWDAGWRSFLIHPILGYGFVSEMDAIKFALGKSLLAHNTYIGLLIQFGVIGFSFFIIGISKLIKKLIVCHDLVLFGFIIATLQLSLVVSAQVAFFFWIPIIIIVCVVNNVNYDKDFIVKNLL